MALSSLMTKALLARLKPGSTIAAMGYPDMIAPLDALEDYMTPDRLRSLEYRRDSADICKRHGIPFRGIPDAHSFFKTLDAHLDVFDIVQERGCEILCDLNYAIPLNLGGSGTGPFGYYDFVLDVGTLEHCFNIGQAALNMAELLKVGGVILHENPFNWGNHGFYGLNPTWYADFYGQQGFKLHECKLATRDGRTADVQHTKRFRFTEEEVNVFAVAGRTEIMPIKWPTQTKYARLIDASHVK